MPFHARRYPEDRLRDLLEGIGFEGEEAAEREGVQHPPLEPRSGLVPVLEGISGEEEALEIEEDGEVFAGRGFGRLGRGFGRGGDAGREEERRERDHCFFHEVLLYRLIVARARLDDEGAGPYPHVRRA